MHTYVLSSMGNQSVPRFMISNENSSLLLMCFVEFVAKKDIQDIVVKLSGEVVTWLTHNS